MAHPNFFAELKRRNVYKVAVAYAVVGWLVIQAASILFPTFDVPPIGMKLLVFIFAAGFIVALVVAWAFEMTPEGMKRTSEVSADDFEALPSWSKRRFAVFLIGLAVTAISPLAFQLLRSRGSTTPRQNARAARTEAATADKSIAVVPLVNQSGDPNREYFSDGLSEELINVLGQIRELRVIGRNSSFRFKGKSDDSRVIAQALQVANVLEGSVRKAGDRVRISLQLVNTADDSQRWSQTYDRDLKVAYYTVTHPLLKPYYGDPRFVELCKKSGFPVPK